jgi:adenylate kinase
LLLMLEVDDAELKKRLLLRGEKAGRVDDGNPEVIMNRILVYKAQTMPVATFYKNQEKYYPINGMRTEAEVFSTITETLNKFMN